jgi:hypothetical protein
MNNYLMVMIMMIGNDYDDRFLYKRTQHTQVHQCLANRRLHAEIPELLETIPTNLNN